MLFAEHSLHAYYCSSRSPTVRTFWTRILLYRSFCFFVQLYYNGFHNLINVILFFSFKASYQKSVYINRPTIVRHGSNENSIGYSDALSRMLNCFEPSKNLWSFIYPLWNSLALFLVVLSNSCSARECFYGTSSFELLEVAELQVRPEKSLYHI